MLIENPIYLKAAIILYPPKSYSLHIHFVIINHKAISSDP